MSNSTRHGSALVFSGCPSTAYLPKCAIISRISSRFTYLNNDAKAMCVSLEDTVELTTAEESISPPFVFTSRLYTGRESESPAHSQGLSKEKLVYLYRLGSKARLIMIKVTAFSLTHHMTCAKLPGRRRNRKHPLPLLIPLLSALRRSSPALLLSSLPLNG